MVEENIHQHEEIDSMKKWIADEFKRHGMNENDIIDSKAWFLHDLEYTPQGDENLPIVSAVYQTLDNIKPGAVLVSDFVNELAKIMHDFEYNLESFNEGLNEKKESLNRLNNEIPNAYARFSKANKVPTKTICGVKPTFLECSRLGTYSIFVSIGGEKRAVATNVGVKIKDTPVALQIPTEYEVVIRDPNEQMQLQLFQGSKLIAEGVVSAFALVSDLTPETNVPGQIFEKINGRLSLFQKDEIIAYLTLEIQYSFSPSLFYSVIAISKQEQEVFIKQFEEDIKVCTLKIKEIQNEFAQIKFDYMSFSFFSEEEELKEFKALRKVDLKQKPAPAQKSEENRKRDCDCCLIF